VVGDEVKTIMLTECSSDFSYEVVIESQGDHSVWTQVMKIDGEQVQELGASD
jgi:hypothetical protein